MRKLLVIFLVMIVLVGACGNCESAHNGKSKREVWRESHYRITVSVTYRRTNVYYCNSYTYLDNGDLLLEDAYYMSDDRASGPVNVVISGSKERIIEENPNYGI